MDSNGEAKTLDEKLQPSISRASKKAAKTAQKYNAEVVFLEGNKLYRKLPDGRVIKVRRVKVKRKRVACLPTRLLAPL